MDREYTICGTLFRHFVWFRQTQGHRLYIHHVEFHRRFEYIKTVIMCSRETYFVIGNLHFCKTDDLNTDFGYWVPEKKPFASFLVLSPCIDKDSVGGLSITQSLSLCTVSVSMYTAVTADLMQLKSILLPISVRQCKLLYCLCIYMNS